MVNADTIKENLRSATLNIHSASLNAHSTSLNGDSTSLNIKDHSIAAPAPLFDHGNSLFSLGGTDLWDNQKAFDEYARTLLPLAYDDFFAAAKSAMKPRHRTMLHKLLDFHFDRRATRYNLPPNRFQEPCCNRSALLLTE